MLLTFQTLTCPNPRCLYIWQPRTPTPKRCPECFQRLTRKGKRETQREIGQESSSLPRQNGSETLNRTPSLSALSDPSDSESSQIIEPDYG